jgi:phosphate transport system protein
MRAFADGDYELARTLKLQDRELDSLTDHVSERFINRVASDSELVSSYVDLIFVARALERIGDHATNIAEDSFWRDQATDIRHSPTAQRKKLERYVLSLISVRLFADRDQ